MNNFMHNRMRKAAEYVSKPKMAFQLGIIKTASKPTFYSFPILLVSFLLILSITADDQNTKTTNIGAIIDDNSRSGKEQRTAMEIAVENFNNNSMNPKFSLIFRNSGRDPLQAAYAAEELIKEKKAQVIIGMETWPEASLVAAIGDKAQVPVLSFASASTKSPLLQLKWPYLIQMATKYAEQMNCIAAILNSYKWKRVIAIYEDDMYGGDSGMLSLLSEALQSVGTEIEFSLALPPLSSLSDPEGYVIRETVKLLNKSSRVFIVLESSFSLANHFFREAKDLGLMGKDSVWIVTDNSVVSFKEGALGIESYYSKDSEPFLKFKIQFQEKFKMKYPEEDQDHSYPGIHAVRAYDSISTISHAMKRLDNEESTSKTFLNTILSSIFTGLSGDIRFLDGSLSPSPIFKIVNIVARKSKELGFWSSKVGFSKSPSWGENINGGETMEEWDVTWPGNLNRVPKGWAMPSVANPMMIGVPGRTSFEKFVKVESDGTPNGFSIAVFKQVVNILEKDYPLPYEFVPYYGSYDDLVNLVINKTYHAIVGDVTILADRSKYVEFTQPYTESGLRMIVPVKSQAHKAWMFTKPFTGEMWLVTFSIMIYTMLIVWFLEHQSNPEFRGPWKYQLGTALWFTFSTIFYVHTEKLRSNITRVVVVVWLFLVMVLTSSYTASLSSMLTVPRLEPTVTDIGLLLRTNATVGCDGDSFVKTYLKNVLKFDREHIKNITSQDDYPNEFKSGNITAAFLELPYEKIFLKEHCNKYTVTGPSYRFGGLGFVFQKGSPIASDVSRAILMLSEKGDLKRLEDEWLGTPSICSNNEGTNTDSLPLHSFQALYLFSAAISTLSLLAFLIRSLRRNRQEELYTGDKTLADKSILGKAILSGTKSLGRGLTFARGLGRDERRSSKWEYVRTSYAPDHLHSTPQTEIEMEIPINSSR